jgi:hypothetical protein
MSKSIVPSSRQVLLPGLVLLLATGCSHGPPYGDLSGQVTLNGQPVQSGTMRFEPADGNSASAGTVIQDSRYTVHLPVNSFRVKISSPKSPKATGQSEGGLMEEAIPSRYNIQTELSVEVNEGNNQKDFSLVSK